MFVFITAVLILAGSAIDLGEAGDRADAVMACWYPGAQGGKAVADLILGRVSPSGKLPVTFYRNEDLERMPDFTDYSMRERTYRYFTGEPLYPFGYGLRYGACSLSALEADRQAARVRVRNESARTLEEVVELYLKDEGSNLAPPNPILCGFARVHLAAGEEKELRVAIDPRAFTVVDDEGKRIPGSGSWTLYAGFGGPDKRTEALTGRKALSLPIRLTP